MISNKKIGWVWKQQDREEIGGDAQLRKQIAMYNKESFLSQEQNTNFLPTFG